MLHVAVQVVGLHAAVHVAYEIQTLAELPRHISQTRPSGPTTLHHACIEAALLHARALIEFFDGRPEADERPLATRRDITALALAPSFRRENEFHLWLPLLDRHLAHLSWKRVDFDESASWRITDLIDGILDEYGRFVDALPGAATYRTVLETSLDEAVYQRRTILEDLIPGSTATTD